MKTLVYEASNIDDNVFKAFLYHLNFNLEEAEEASFLIATHLHIIPSKHNLGFYDNTSAYETEPCCGLLE